MKVAQKLSKMQSEINCPKNQYNNFGKYKYRSLEDIFEGLKPLISKYNVAVTVSDEIVDVGGRVYVKAVAMVTCGETGDCITNTAFAREPIEQRGMSESQVTGATSSYSRKYALNGLFAIDDTKDADSKDNNQPIQNISNQQAGMLSGLIADTNTDLSKFCQAYNIQKLTDLPSDQFAKALKQLQTKKGKQ